MRITSKKEIIATAVNPEFSLDQPSRHKQELRLALWLQRDFTEILEATRHPLDRDNDPTFIHAHIQRVLDRPLDQIQAIPERFLGGIRIAMYSLWFTKHQQDLLQPYLRVSETRQECIQRLLYNGLLEHYYSKLEALKASQNLYIDFPVYSETALVEMRLTDQPHKDFSKLLGESVKVLSNPPESMFSVVSVSGQPLTIRKDWIKNHD